MIWEDVAGEIAAQIKTLGKINVFDFWVKKVPVPGATVGIPAELTYNQTYGPGMELWSVPIMVMVGNVSAASSARELLAYMDSGPRSIRKCLEAGAWTTCDDVIVKSVAPMIYTSGGVELLGAEFTVDVIGNG